MANQLSKTGITTGNTVRSWHVTQSIDAFNGTEAYDITLSGSLTYLDGTEGDDKILVTNSSGQISSTSGITGSFTGSFEGDGSGLTNLPTTTASNGLTQTGDVITLGGTLTGDTSIDLSGYIISLEGEYIRLLSDATEKVEFAMAAGLAGGGLGFRGFSDISFPNYGKQGDMFIRSGADSNGLSIISYPGTGTDDSIRFFAGDPLGSSGIPNIHIQGSGSTMGFVGIGTDTPLAKHHVEIAAIPGDEVIQLWSISDSLNGLRVINGTTTDNTFLPTLIASSVDNDNIGMVYATQITDDTGTNPVTAFDSRLPAGIVVNRPLFDWRSIGTTYMTMGANGDLGIGTITPIVKLDVDGVIKSKGRIQNQRTVSVVKTLNNNDEIVFITATTNYSVTLPASPVSGQRLLIYRNYNGFGSTTTTIDGNGNNIEWAGGSSLPTRTMVNDDQFDMVYNGAVWRILK